MNKHKVIYSVGTEDISTVANDVLGREPTIEETKFVEKKIGNHFQWFDVIANLLSEFCEKASLGQREKLVKLNSGK